MGKSTVKTYKHSVWKSFARYIKMRDANKNGYCVCCTCSKAMMWESPDCQAGHFVAGRSANILFDETVVHAQCSACNNYGGGKVWEYGQFMRKKYGMSIEDLDELQARKHIVKKYSMEELKDLKKHFDTEFNRIKEEKGL